MVREFEGVRYRIHKKERVREYVIAVAREEWEPRDFDLYGADLFNSVWMLREVPMAKIKPNKELLASPEFQEDLRHRIQKVKALLRDGEPLPPLILRGSDLLILDGYARYSVLVEMKITKCLAYVGELVVEPTPGETRPR